MVTPPAPPPAVPPGMTKPCEQVRDSLKVRLTDVSTSFKSHGTYPAEPAPGTEKMDVAVAFQEASVFSAGNAITKQSSGYSRPPAS